MAPCPIVLAEQLVTTETFSFPCWHTSRHTNACVQFPAVDIFAVTELNSPRLFTTIFSHIFNLLSVFTYDSTSLCMVLTSPSTMPSFDSSCTRSPNSALFHLSSLPYTLSPPAPIQGPSHSLTPPGWAGSTRKTIECLCLHQNSLSSLWSSQGQWNMEQMGTASHWLTAHKSHWGSQNALCHQTQNPY